MRIFWEKAENQNKKLSMVQSSATAPSVVQTLGCRVGVSVGDGVVGVSVIGHLVGKLVGDKNVGCRDDGTGVGVGFMDGEIVGDRVVVGKDVGREILGTGVTCCGDV